MDDAALDNGDRDGLEDSTASKTAVLGMGIVNSRQRRPCLHAHLEMGSEEFIPIGCIEPRSSVLPVNVDDIQKV